METRVYLFRYYCKGSWWALEIPATSKEEAEEKIQCISSAEYDGILELTIEVPSSN